MKKLFLILFCFVILNSSFAKELVFDGENLVTKDTYNSEETLKNKVFSTDRTEIFCECIKKVSYKNRFIEDYDNFSFYIDDEKEKLYWAPSDNEVSGYPTRWDSFGINYSNVIGPEKTIGDININRQSGAFYMKFSSRFYSFQYTGKCTKVTNDSKF